MSVLGARLIGALPPEKTSGLMLAKVDSTIGTSCVQLPLLPGFSPAAFICAMI